MTKAVFSIKDGKIMLTVEGHAGFAERGTDIVCAGCSTLFYTLAATVDKAYEDGLLRDKPIIECEPGRARVECEPKVGFAWRVSEAFDVIKCGYEVLAENFPDYVSVKG